MTHVSSGRRLRWWMILMVGQIALLLLVILAPLGVSHEGSAGRAGRIDGLRFYWLTFVGLWLLLSGIAGLLWTLQQKQTNTATGSRSQPRRYRWIGFALGPNQLLLGKLTAVTVVLGVALVVRLLTVLTTCPQLSDDIWRYIYDGHTLAVMGDNPYRLAPQDQGVEAPINHPHLVTIYQPTSQWVFAALAATVAWVSNDIAALPAEQFILYPPAHRLFRGVFSCFDLVIVGLLLWKLAQAQRSLWWALLYAWHPLVISEVAASGHQDVIGVAFLLTCMVILDGRVTTWRRSALAGTAFGLAVAVKPLVLPLAFVIVWSHRRQWRTLAGGIGAALAALAVLYLPFALMNGGLERMLNTTYTFIGKWAFNGSVHAYVQAISDSKTVADGLSALALITVLIVCMVRQLDVWRTAQAYFLASLLLSSTVHPWYLLWALALLPVRFDAALWIFSLTVSWSYAVLIDVKTYTLPTWLLIAEYVPVYVALMWHAGAGRKQKPYLIMTRALDWGLSVPSSCVSMCNLPLTRLWGNVSCSTLMRGPYTN